MVEKREDEGGGRGGGWIKKKALQLPLFSRKKRPVSTFLKQRARIKSRGGGRGSQKARMRERAGGGGKRRRKEALRN